ncbi:MAG: MerR family transcriptional regulator [Alphaproteobacteria bacterium]|nr:MerR family transcriptional regulator [Alphaproteobacteria bacterium]
MVEAHYKMAAVVRLTGIPANTLRTWERRYGITSPDRSAGGARLYREDDVVRLQLVSALLEHGEAIGALADLEIDDLRARLDVHRRTAPEPLSGPAEVAVAVLGQGLAAQLRSAPHAGVELFVPFDGGGVDELLAERPAVDVVLVQLAALGSSPVSAFRQVMEITGARLGVVVYDFAPASLLWRLGDAGARLVQGPSRIASLVQVIQDHLDLDRVRRASRPFPAPPTDDERPERYFGPSELGWLREARSGIQCECPNHLASLVESLNAFEDYSLKCESRDEDDAALHASLALGAARARAQLELLLQSVIEADALEIPDQGGPEGV